MAEQPLACPFCGGAANVGETWAWCTQCPADMASTDAATHWAHRTPSPATRTMLEYAKDIAAMAREMDQGQGFKPDVLKVIQDMEAFIIEWPNTERGHDG